ncbi:MAG: penicillin-binding protein 2 [Dethiobacteria bacterium]
MDKQTLKRLRFMLLFIITVFVVLSSRLAYMQVIQYEEYLRRAEENIFRKLPITAPRGSIYDRDGVELVTNRPGFSVSLLDLGNGYDAETIAYLSKLLEITEEEIWDKIYEQRYRRYLPVRLKNDVSFDIIAKISERRTDLVGVLIEAQPIRYYVNDHLAAHVLGRMGETDELSSEILKEWAEKGYEYRPGDVIGLAGLEMVWEPYLRGANGEQRVEINFIGQAIGYYEKLDPVPGSDLCLTVDFELQRETERVLADIVAGLQEEGNEYAKKAVAVALDPRSGAIRAMASYPAYNPNTFSRDFTELSQDPARPLINNAIAEYYPVGSTFKMLTGIAALEEGKLRPGERILDRGSLTRFNKTVRNYGSRAFGYIDIVRAFQVSSNVFFAELGARLGIDALAEYGRLFGFGSTTGLQDIRGERAGHVASRETKAKFHDDPWYPSETLDAAIGQGFHNITPLQLANYVAMIANEGIHYRPYLVEEVYDYKGGLVFKAEPEILNEVEISPQTWALIKEGMAQVMRPGGTAWYPFRDFPVAVAGKTGSAQVVALGGVNIPPHSLFVGFAPLEEPEIALAVLIEHGGIGADAAVPAAHGILSAYFGVENSTSTSPGADIEQETGD